MSSSSSLQRQLKGLRDFPLRDDSDYPFTSLVAFHDGYESAYAAAQHGQMAPLEFVPPHLRQFV
jgi:hypothetical protein